MPGSCSAVTPAAALLGTLAHTPATAATGPSTTGAATTGGPAALVDAQFLPTPAPMPLASLLRHGSSAAAAEEAAVAAAVPIFKPPAPRGVLTSLKSMAGAGMQQQQAQQQAEPAAAPASDGAGHPVPAPGPTTMDTDDSAAPAVQQEVQVEGLQADAASAAAAAAAAAVLPQGGGGLAEVPTPVMQAFAAADQLMYHQPRPSSCPPLFK